jgi:hypothetical protein
MRKKNFAIIIVALIALISISLALPATSQARGWRGGGWGWYGPAAFGGGLLLGSALARPYYYAPPPVYAYPPPVYAYPPPAAVYSAPPPAYYPNQGYAYPDPAVAPRTENRPSQPGQWVEVPGQSINGRWVPSHQAWVPDNP